MSNCPVSSSDGIDPSCRLAFSGEDSKPSMIPPSRLSDFIKNNEASGSKPDVAAVLYNRACYYSLKSATDKNPLPLREKALEDLEHSIKLWEDTKKLVQGEDDFKPLKEDSAFAPRLQALVT